LYFPRGGQRCPPRSFGEDVRLSIRDRDHLRIRRGAIGILTRGDECLIVRRSPRVSKGGFWCFPGGHVEAGETSRKAIQRELAEELGILVEPLRRLGALRVLDSRHVLVVWLVDHLAGDFNPAKDEIDEYRWLPWSAVVDLNPGLPSNAEVVRLMSKYQGNASS
jgi:8-oxo-dGTP diphosphatase